MWPTAGRLLYRLTRPVLSAVLGETYRVRVVVRTDTHIMLVKTWLSSQKWELPGGGVHRAESPNLAAAREVKEETGLTLEAEDIRIHGDMQISTGFSDKKYTAAIAVITMPSAASLRAKWPEVLGADWFPLDSLPADTKKHVAQALKLLEN